jgi:hypothetical protein
MHKAFVGVSLIALSAGLTARAVAQAPPDSVHGNGTGAAAAAPAGDGALTMPAEVRGYHLVDSTQLGGDAGTQYDYAHDHDTLHVLVAPYQPGDRLAKRDDTTAYVLNDVDTFFQALELATRQGNDNHFELLHRGSEDMRSHGHHIAGSAGWARLTKLGTRGRLEVYSYYATYALPKVGVRVRAELPWLTARNTEVTPFTTALVGDLAAEY